jgi:hypothetical protein
MAAANELQKKQRHQWQQQMSSRRSSGINSSSK